MQESGYLALLAGEVIHIVKCVLVEIKLAQIQECYDQLSVIRDKTLFLIPQTNILLRQGTQVTCNLLAPTMYLLEFMVRLTPKPVETLSSLVLKPMTKPTRNISVLDRSPRAEYTRTMI